MSSPNETRAQAGAVCEPPLLNVVTLLPYQRRWLEDDSKLKIVVKARQTGYSFAATLRAVLECLKRKTTWVFLSKGERQSRLLMEKVAEHVQSCGIVARALESTFLESTTIRQLETRFPNGSVIYGLPANPDTARGYTGNVTLDEFAFHQDAAKVYAALYPTVTRGYSIEVISTPNGQQGKFFELAKAAGLATTPSSPPQLRRGIAPQARGVVGTRRVGEGWSGHRTSLHDAVVEGLEIDIEALRAGCDDEETWLQEYCCEFLSDAQNYIPMELIMGCVSEAATTDWDVARTSASEVRGFSRTADLKDAGLRYQNLFLGIDIGRKRDLTVAWLFEKLGDVLWSRVLLAMRGQTFDSQEKAICDLIEGVTTPLSPPEPGGDFSRLPSSSEEGHRGAAARGGGPIIRRCGIDQSGLGMMLAERLEKKYGAVVEPVQFTAQVKERLAPMVKQAFEERLVRIPDHRDIRADINAVKRFVTPAGNVRFDAEHTDRGHADRFWALALALNAASAPIVHLAEVGKLLGKPVTAGMRERIL